MRKCACTQHEQNAELNVLMMVFDKGAVVFMYAGRALDNMKPFQCHAIQVARRSDVGSLFEGAVRMMDQAKVRLTITERNIPEGLTASQIDSGTECVPHCRMRCKTGDGCTVNSGMFLVSVADVLCVRPGLCSG